MRLQVLFLLISLIFLSGIDCLASRLDRIHAGMTRTDVAIELGSPYDVKVEDQATVWIYPQSETQMCKIKFVKQKVTEEPMVCEAQQPSAQLTAQASRYLNYSYTDSEYEGRVQRYCGVKPRPRPGCHISEQCINGAWEQVCDGTGGGSTPGESDRLSTAVSR